jgi:hypothetical protein
MLGAFEAGLFPGVTYYLSWYVRLAFWVRKRFLICTTVTMQLV